MNTFSIARRISIVALIASTFCGLTALGQGQPKIGTVDLKKVFDGYYRTKQCDVLLQNSGADADKVLAGMLDEYKKGQQEYNKLIESANDQAVSADEREKRRKTAETKVVELKEIEKSITQFRKTAETNILEQKARMRENILKDIQEEINAIAKAGSYTFMLDSSALAIFQTPILLYNNGQSDISDELLTKLNAKAPPGALTAEPKEEKTFVVPPPKAPEKDEKPAAAPTKPAPKKK
jgi:Skp family chaperone for outer membrane proteins